MRFALLGLKQPQRAPFIGFPNVFVDKLSGNALNISSSEESKLHGSYFRGREVGLLHYHLLTMEFPPTDN